MNYLRMITKPFWTISIKNIWSLLGYCLVTSTIIFPIEAKRIGAGPTNKHVVPLVRLIDGDF